MINWPFRSIPESTARCFRHNSEAKVRNTNKINRFQIDSAGYREGMSHNSCKSPFHMYARGKWTRRARCSGQGYFGRSFNNTYEWFMVFGVWSSYYGVFTTRPALKSLRQATDYNPSNKQLIIESGSSSTRVRGKNINILIKLIGADTMWGLTEWHKNMLVGLQWLGDSFIFKGLLVVKLRHKTNDVCFYQDDLRRFIIYDIILQAL